MNKEKALQIIAENKKSYNAIAPDFDAARRTAWPEFEMLKPYIKEGSRILDIGCGNGRLYKYLCAELSSAHYVGIDQSEELIKIAKKMQNAECRMQNCEKAEFMTADVFDLPFQDGEFDLVAGIAFLHHIPSQELRAKVLKEIYRVLKPGGILFLTNWNLFRWEIIAHNVKRNKMNPLHFFFPHGGMDAGDFWIPFRVPLEALKISPLTGRASNGGNPVPRYYHHFRKGELAGLAREAGFKIIFHQKKKNIVSVLQKLFVHNSNGR